MASGEKGIAPFSALELDTGTGYRLSLIHILLLTAKQSVENKVEGLTIGADDYVTKPFNMEVLILRMRKLIEMCIRDRSLNIR